MVSREETQVQVINGISSLIALALSDYSSEYYLPNGSCDTSEDVMQNAKAKVVALRKTRDELENIFVALPLEEI